MFIKYVLNNNCKIELNSFDHNKSLFKILVNYNSGPLKVHETRLCEY